MSRDAAYCYCCRLFHNNPESTFTTTGYQDWKHAMGSKGVFNLHSSSEVHQEAMLNWAEYKKRITAGESIGMCLDRMGQQQISDNRQYVQILIECVLYCSQQGIAFRGHEEGEKALNPGNLRCLMRLMSRHSHPVKQRLQESSNACQLPFKTI